MKIMKSFLILMVLLCIHIYTKDDFPDLKGPYLGQKPPGMTPEIFAPGIISKGTSEVCIAFTPDGKELFYGLWEKSPFIAILHMKEENGRWTGPKVANFSGRYSDLKFTISPDGKKLVFTSNRPLKCTGEPTKLWHLWFVEKTEDSWSSAIGLGPFMSSDESELYPTISSYGNLYFFSDHGPGQGGCDIHVSNFKDGSFIKAMKLSSSINTELNEGDPFIAPDGSFIIFCCRDREDCFGSNDLYISFRKSDQSWSKARNMGRGINSSANDTCPSISPDGKYLFFTSNRGVHKKYSNIPISYEELIKNLNNPGNGYSDIYWVDAKIIDLLKPAEIK